MENKRHQIIFNVTEEDHKGVKVQAALRGISIKEFIMTSIKIRLESEKKGKSS